MNTKTIVKGVLPFVILAGGIGAVIALKGMKSEPERAERESQGLLVETSRVQSSTHEIVVRANGRVIPARQVVVGSQVPGRVRWISDDLVPGGQFAAGDTMVRLDTRDYRLAVQARQAEVNRAQLELQLEASRQEVARREWQSFGASSDSGSADGEALALREPQRETAEVGVRAARSSASRAQLDLSRTTARAPFNAMVLTGQADVGQYVGPGAPLATLVGTDAFWVQVSLPVADLQRIRVAPEGGSSATVSMMVDEKTVSRDGSVVRLLPDLDPMGSMARVLVEIRDPLGLQQEGTLPMLLGSYVTVTINAEGVTDAIEVPRLAVREGRRVYVMTPDDTLEIRDIEVAWSRDQSVLVSSGLSNGERLIVSRVPAPVEGMPLREELRPSATRADANPEASPEAAP